jgi:NAD+ kinase
MTQVLLVAHHQRAEAAALARSAASWLHQRGAEAWMTVDDASALDLEELGNSHDPRSADLVVSLGGDGTMLRAVQLLDGAPVPIIGVNVGLLGYLTEVEPPAMTTALERFVAGPGADDGDWEVERRMMVDVVLRRSGSHVDATRGDAASGEGIRPDTEERWRGLNEGVLEKQEPGHTVRMMVRIDGAPFTTYAADGLIVATPTGSTARGPVVSPRHRALLLTPVSPHMLFDRSLVLDPEESVEVEVVGHRPIVLSVDGQRAASLNEGDTVEFRASAAEAHFVRFGRRRFHQILKAKFGLSDR